MRAEVGPASVDPRRAGMTLLEIVVASAITVIVVVLAAHLFVTVTRSAARQAQWIEFLLPADRALDRLGRDLACSLVPGSATGEVFLVERMEHAATSFSFVAIHTLIPEAGEEDLRWSAVHRVAYRAVAAPGADGVERVTLLRESHRRRGPQAARPPVEEILVTGVLGFDVHVLADDTWHAAWPIGDGSSLPQAARISLTIDVGGRPKTFATEILIPAGMVIKPTA